ncbi:dihydrolipoyllysine-residue acetyltransferase component of pyruvate dehydrogenase complex [Paraglaciecola mesophila KMM 241]|uniref:Acetyltransferase component of pyruvate dehydrogenase complex n=1 Tax=Paraglaciecola mesophila KMM 241 TaxID=1128912 RepID=K6ZSN1_9ALTE|nr:dihydrolipoyllysine-residue acetyltransferase [Paraglaciecola mesophila]GAC26310.1 dihydrolipoyllysine-residue acetyltransferase component of pyruvate dehydrogenase complex [Paraglaciecola mesophila KMM 241]
MSDIKDVLVPDVGGDEVEVIEVLVAVGDDVDAEASLITVESDKASMDIPAPFAGKISDISVKVGDKISQDQLIMKMSSGDSAPAAEEPQEQAPEPAKTETASPAKEEAPAASSAAQVIEVTVPDIGGDTDVEVIEILVAAGDSIEEETGLVTLETDKATMDVPSPKAGVVKEVKLSTGDKVSEGSLVILLEVASSAPAQADSAPQAQAAPAQEQTQAESAPAAQEEQASGEPETIEVTVPDIGGDTDVDVIEVLVAVGDKIEEETGLITLETDKATMDVPAPKAGVVKELKINVGDKVSEGSVVLLLEVAGSAVKAAPKAAPEPQAAQTSAPAQQAPKSAPVPHHPSAGERGKAGKVHASPSVRRVAREFGVDLTQVKGTGPKNRVLKEDVQSYVKYELSRPKMTSGSSVNAGGGGLQVLAPPKVDFSKFGEVEEIPLTRIQKISGPNLHRNWVTIPHVTQFEEADITDLEAFRKQQNVVAEKKKLGFKITPLVFMMKAVADALQAYPVFNSSLSESGESLIQKKYFHVGIAVETPNGLVVPVVRDVDKKGIYELSRELMEISIKARDGKLKAADMQGSCFTISSLGGIGGTAFTPIVNAPDVAILGVSKSEMKPKWNGKDFEPRLMLPLSLSYDHRVIDGAVAARFAVHLGKVLGDLREMLL